MLQTSSLVGCLSDSSQREITHQVSQEGSLRKGEKADASQQIMSGYINIQLLHAWQFGVHTFFSSELHLKSLLFLWHYHGTFYLQKTITTLHNVLVSLNFKLTWQTYGTFRSTMCPTCLSTNFLSSLWRVSLLSGWERWVAIKEVKGQEGTCLALTSNIYRQHRQPGHFVCSETNKFKT